MHQFKINGKRAFDGDVWQWHQDYGTWRADDEMPEARAMNVAVFLDEVNEFNGPLLFIPGSHKLGALEASHDLSTTSYPLWTIDNETIEKLVERGGIVAPRGPAGSMLMFHSCLVHGSSSNMSPWNRTIVYLSLCAVSNHIRRFKRPDYIAHRDFTPIEPLPDDCLHRRRGAHHRPAARPGGLRRPMNLHQTPARAPGGRQAPARRPDRRRQVRLDVPVAGAAHAGHRAGRRRRPGAGPRAREAMTRRRLAGRRGSAPAASRRPRPTARRARHRRRAWR